MQFAEFISKFRSRYLWYNLLAMAGTIIVFAIGIKVGLAIYTHHGEVIEIPDVKHKSMTEARRILEEQGLVVEVGETRYVKELPADCVLEQTPAAGARVKSGHIIALTLNASDTPTRVLPDIIDNCSLREALAKLNAMGFKVGQPKRITGEKDWVYGVTVDGREMSSGSKIPVDKTIIILVGDGKLGAQDSVQVVDYYMDGSSDEQYESEEDPFEEVL